ncbi:MAG: glycogen debranching enzyme family protein [Rikenellaceae bacterium]|nr:glycogen debranching enzyme family protein [Rikenellaceae bacterium]
MSVLNFDKDQLGNLEYSLQREMLSTDRKGGYMSTTIVCCNTRKYHGLVVTPIDDTDRRFVLLSSLDETVIQHDQAFNLALHRFPGIYEPRGHKYIIDFQYTPTPTITYRVGGVVLRKEMLWIHSRTQLLIRYTLVDAHSRTLLRLRPFLAFRENHTVGQANMYANGHSYPVVNGVKSRMYAEFPWLYMQTDKKAMEFVAAPDWYYNFEYAEEARRGYPAHEDLMTTGYFEGEIAKGESVIFSCSLEEMGSAKEIDKLFEEELARRTNKVDFLSCLRHSARQFIVRRGERTDVIAGYPWFGHWGRDTFIALPGLTLSQGDVKSCRDVLDTQVRDIKDGLFPNLGESYNSVDAALWFFWTLQQLDKHVGAKEVWESYGAKMKEVLEAFRRGIGEWVAVDANGLVRAGHPTLAMTWMDAVVDGKPVTGREGYQVEVNALWYNAVCYTLELARKYKDKEFVAAWKDMPEKIKASFVEKFWLEREGYLADYVTAEGEVNSFIRPNQIIACSMDYKMLNSEQCVNVYRVVRQHLATPKGLRTLSPRNPLYQGRIEGDQRTRDLAYHQGTVWVWLMEHYVKAGFDLKGEKFLQAAEDMLSDFEEDLTMSGIGSINEIYDGDPPHAPRGAVSQAWSVAAVLRINEMIESYRKPAKKAAKKAVKAEAEVEKAEVAEKPAKKCVKKCAPKAEKAAKEEKPAAKKSVKKVTKK